MERIAAGLMLAAFSPLLVLIASIIVVLSRSSPFVRHARVGWRGRPLRMLKFRTMWGLTPACSPWRFSEDVSGTPRVPKKLRDERITSRFAFFCRRYSLDELPQLWHVVRGEMSLVGPRPVTRAELDAYYANCEDEVLSLRPGMTGLWQVMGRNDLTYSARRRFDRILVRKASALLYFVVLIRSIPSVVSGRGAW
jgi:lipopolysaccharide/colanic/teichoic acid biosynthesis glycosyltransferase